MDNDGWLILPNMQFKFFVDGEWKHDEHQPYAAGEYGIVNTIFVAAEHNYVLASPVGSNVPPLVSNMDVDGTSSQRLVRIGALL